MHHADPDDAPVLARPHDSSERARFEFERRRFLQGALVAGSLAAISPKLLGSSIAEAVTPLGPTDRILVMIELNGGNDGLSTVVPYGDGRYYDYRRTSGLAYEANQVLPIGEGLGLHPNLTYVKSRFDAGDVAVVRGVSHPQNDRSHFATMARMMHGLPSNPVVPTGWLGRFADGLTGNDLAAVAIGGSGVPLLLDGQRSIPIGLPSGGTLFGGSRKNAWEAILYDRIASYGEVPTGLGTWPDEVGRVTRSAMQTSAWLAPIYTPSITTRALERDLTLAARLINLDLGPRVVHVSTGSFDSHSTQLPYYDGLLLALDKGIQAFFASLDPRFAGRVVLATYSEFGRRVQPNGSAGTDHGGASNLLVVGRGVRGGLHGQQPSLATLDRGDLAMTVDVRSVFASMLSTWLGADDRTVLGATYTKLDLFDLTKADTGVPSGGGGAGPLPVTGGAPAEPTAIAPVLAPDGRLCVFGVNTHQPTGQTNIYQRSQTSPGGGWSGWSAIPGQLTAVASVMAGYGRLELFGVNARQPSGQNNIYRAVQQWNGGPWSSWQALDGYLTSIAAARNADGRLELFGVNAQQPDGQNNVYRRWQLWAGGPWSGWESIAGYLTSVSVAANADGRLHLFGVNTHLAAGTTNVFHRWQTRPGGAWSGWQAIPGYLTSIAAALNADGRIGVFGVNCQQPDGQNNLYQTIQQIPGGSFTGWSALPGYLTSVGAAMTLGGRLEVWGANAHQPDGQNNVYRAAQSSPGGPLGAWESIAGYLG